MKRNIYSVLKSWQMVSLIYHAERWTEKIKKSKLKNKNCCSWEQTVRMNNPYDHIMYLLSYHTERHCFITSNRFFCVRIESRIESAARFDFELNFRIESAVYTTQAVTPSNELHPYLFCICHEREWCTQLSTCYSFQFSPKTRQTMPLYDHLTPKLHFKRKLNHCQSFLYKGRLTVRTIRKFQIGSSLRIESRIGSSIQNRIESRSFAGPYS